MFWHVSIQIFHLCLVHKLQLGMKFSLPSRMKSFRDRQVWLIYEFEENVASYSYFLHEHACSLLNLLQWVDYVITFAFTSILETASSVDAFIILHLRHLDFKFIEICLSSDIASDSSLLDVIFHHKLKRKSHH